MLLGDNCGVGKIEFILHFDNGNINYCGSKKINDGKWHHLFVTINRQSKIEIYADGILDGTYNISAFSGLNMATSNKVYIGTYPNISGTSPGTLYFNGSIDEVAVWNEAFNLNQVRTIYENQTAKFGGSFLSRIFDGLSTSANWTKLNWKTSLPFGKNLTTTNEVKTDYSGLVDSSGVSSDSSLATGLVSLWHLDDAANATSVADSQSTNTGSPISITFQNKGKLDKAVSFNGSSSRVSISNNPWSNLASGSISVWIKIPSDVTWPSGVNGHTFRYILGSSSYSGGKLFYRLKSDGSSLGTINNNSGTCDLGSTAAGTWKYDNKWYLFTMTWSAGTAYVYKDGEQIASCPMGVSTSGAGSAQDYLGMAWDGNPFYGFMDELGIWNRALHSEEIKMLYRRGANRLKFQVRSCSSSDCSDDSTGANWKGPDGTNSTYYSELNNNSALAPSLTFTSGPVNNRYFQYKAILESDTLTSSPDLLYVQIDPSRMNTNAPYVVTKNEINYYSLTSAVQTLGSNSCSAGVKYNLGKGTNYSSATWYYWNGSAWSVAGGTESTANSVTELNASSAAALAAFGTQLGEGKVYLKAFLKFDGTSPCELNSFQLSGQY